MVSWEGVFREESWATPLLVLSVLTLCALMLYTVIRFCSWLKPTLTRGSTLLPWLEMPLLLGLMLLTGSGITAAAPLNDASCRLLFLGPSSGYVLVSAGLLSRVIQYVFRPHVFLQWLLFFFVALNQGVISVAYMAQSGWCRLTVQHQLIMLLYPSMLVSAVLVLVFKTVRRRHSKAKPREIIHVGLAATFSGAIGACWIGAATVLTNQMLSACLGYGCLATVVIQSLILFLPRKDIFHDGIYASFGNKDRHSKELTPEEPRVIVVPNVFGGGRRGEGSDFPARGAIGGAEEGRGGGEEGRGGGGGEEGGKEVEFQRHRSRSSDPDRNLRDSRKSHESRRSRESGSSRGVGPHSRRCEDHPRPLRWNNKIRPDSVRRKPRKEKQRRRHQDRATQIYQTPDYYQAWLY